MYSQKIVSAKLSAIQNKISLRPKPQQFNLTKFTPSECQQFNSHLLSLIQYDEKYIPGSGKWKFFRDLTPDETNFIENERIICQNDFLYWTSRYAYIKSKLTDETETLILFNPNIAQKIILDIWAEAEEKFFAILMLYLKARQLGVSTLNELAIAHRVQFFSRINSLVASSDPDKTKKMAAMMQLVWELQPPYLVPEFKIASSKEVWAVFPELKSSVTCQHGTAMSGIARGDTPDIAHLSELPDYSDPSEDVDAALLNAIHETPATFIVLESTAKGKRGSGKWWYEKWKYAKKYYFRNKTRLRPVFLPWFIGTDVWPTKTWCHQFLPKPLSTWKPKRETLSHAIACQRYVQESPLLKKYLGENWKLPPHQQYFWEFTRNEYEESGKLYKFLEELCSSDVEAFQNTGRTIITAEQAEYLRNKAKPLASYYGKPAVFGIIGTGIPPEDEPYIRHIDQTRPFITIKCDWDYSTTPKIFRLIPLIHDIDIWEKRLFIWEFPFQNKNFAQEYCNGVDCSEGIQQDNTAMEIIKTGSLQAPAEQVAEYVSDSLSAASLLPYALALGTFYSNQSESSINQCRQAIEVEFGGNDLQHLLRLAGWSNFHRWEGAYDNIKRRTTHKIGWQTNSWTRPLLMSRVKKAVLDGFFKLNSPYMIEEFANLQKDDDNTRIEAKGEDTDDRWFAGAISFFSLHSWLLYMMDQGDSKVKQMFQSFSDYIPSSEDNMDREISLAEVISTVEKREFLGKSKEYIMNTTLPTLD